MTDNPTTTQKEEPDLFKRTIKGGFWVFALQFATQILGIGKSVIVARCLYLENLGLIAIAMMLIQALNTFSESGFNAALVQKKEDVTDYLDTAWVINIVRGILLFTILFLIAPLFTFKVSPENASLAIAIIRVMAFSFLIGAFRNIGIIYFCKNMDFHKTFWMGIASTLTDICVAIPLVMIYKSVWAYVIARLASASVGLILSYVLCPVRPKFHFVPEKAKELWQFGKWIFGGRILNYILTEGDDFFVWIFLGVPELALYRYAYRFSNMPTTYITNTISKVSFPAYSKIQNDIGRLRQAYLKVLKVTSFFAVPTAFLIFAIGPDFVRMLLPERMWPMTSTLQILAFMGLTKAIGSTRGPIFNALKKPQTTWKLRWLKLIILAVLIYPLTKTWGIFGTALATILVNVIVDPFGVLLMARMIQCSMWKIMQQSLYPIIASAVMASALLTLKHIFPTPPTVIPFINDAMMGIVLYLIVLWTLDVIFDQQFRAIAKEHAVLVSQKIKGFKR